MYLIIIILCSKLSIPVECVIAMRTKNAANYALFEDKIAELVEKRLEDIRQN